MRQDRYGHIMTPKNATEIYDYFQKTLIKLAERLKKSDEFYQMTNEKEKEQRNAKGVNPSFSERFEECPVVRWALDPDRYLVKNFSDMFEGMLRALVSNSNSDSVFMPYHAIENELED